MIAIHKCDEIVHSLPLRDLSTARERNRELLNAILLLLIVVDKYISTDTTDDNAHRKCWRDEGAKTQSSLFHSNNNFVVSHFDSPSNTRFCFFKSMKSQRLNKWIHFSLFSAFFRQKTLHDANSGCRATCNDKASDGGLATIADLRRKEKFTETHMSCVRFHRHIDIQREFLFSFLLSRVWESLSSLNDDRSNGERIKMNEIRTFNFDGMKSMSILLAIKVNEIG